MEIKFEDLTNESRILKITTPIFTPTTKIPDDETEEQIITCHSKILALPEFIKNKLASIETSEKIQKIGISFNLELLKLADISRAIRSFYFEELKLEDMPFILAQEMNIDLTKAKEITQIVIEKIINDKSQEQAYASSLKNLLIPDALKNYPEVGEQLITSSRIKLKSFPEPVRPSVKNWLLDYAFVMGHNAHNSVERGNYIFHSENAKMLTSLDRQRLGHILKCLDENIPITVSKTTKQLIFPKSESNKNHFQQQNTKTASEPKANIHSVEFSYPQKLSFEGRPEPITKRPTIQPQRQPAHGKNVVNLKE